MPDRIDEIVRLLHEAGFPDAANALGEELQWLRVGKGCGGLMPDEIAGGRRQGKMVDRVRRLNERIKELEARLQAAERVVTAAEKATEYLINSEWDYTPVPRDQMQALADALAAWEQTK